MRYVHHKFMILPVFALGLVVCLAGTAYAANPWQTTVSVAPVTYNLRHGPAAGAVHQANATVEVHSNFYSPASVTIKAGETVTWTHVEGFHNVLAEMMGVSAWVKPPMVLLAPVGSPLAIHLRKPARLNITAKSTA